MTFLFLCTGNSCRSILAEATFNSLAPEGLRAMSAGSHPAGFVHPRSIALLKKESISTEGLSSKSWEHLPRPDVVITVCDQASGETCPLYLQQALRAHWGVSDPAKAVGSDHEVEASFERVYLILRYRIEAVFALPLDILNGSPERFKKELDRIGGLMP